MAQSRKSEKPRAENRFYYAAKISEYQFKKVLMSFVLDEPVAVAAQKIALSANSINAIHAKLRHFFTELGVFQDIYKGGDPEAGTEQGEDYEGFEFRLLDFHLKRIRTKRRAKAVAMSEIDYHWTESFWRFHYSILSEGRKSDAVERMMYSHLLAHIRLCGPVGAPPHHLKESARLQKAQFHQRLIWLERNAPSFKDAGTRQALRDFREIDEGRD